MLRPLGKRDDGYELLEISSLEDLDLVTFLPMLDRAWEQDYVDQVRIVFNEAVLRKLTRGGFWVAVLVRSKGGETVGFELALERTLRVGERSFRAYYATAFTVAAGHRRKGLGRFILEGINRLVFEGCGSDLILSTFHEGHAGSPTVESTFDRIPDWGVARFHSTPMWSRRLDKEPLPPLEPAPRCVPIERVGTSPGATLRAGGGGRGSLEVPDAGAIDDLLRAEFQASFALDASLSAQYLNPGNETSGMLLYDLDSVQCCLAGWNVAPVAINGRRLPPIGQLQLLLAPGCSEAQVEKVVHHLGLFLAQRGCFAMSLVDMGTVPPSVLHNLGFGATEDRITFAARGPKRTIEVFAGLQPPYFLDFT